MPQTLQQLNHHHHHSAIPAQWLFFFTLQSLSISFTPRSFHRRSSVYDVAFCASRVDGKASHDIPKALGWRPGRFFSSPGPAINILHGFSQVLFLLLFFPIIYLLVLSFNFLLQFQIAFAIEATEWEYCRSSETNQVGIRSSASFHFNEYQAERGSRNL